MFIRSVKILLKLRTNSSWMNYIRYFLHIVSFYRNFVSRYSKSLSCCTFEETLRRNITIASRIHSRSFRLRKLPKHQVCKWKLARNEIRGNWKKRIAPFSVFRPTVSLLLPRLFSLASLFVAKLYFTRTNVNRDQHGNEDIIGVTATCNLPGNIEKKRARCKIATCFFRLYDCKFALACNFFRHDRNTPHFFLAR